MIRVSRQPFDPGPAAWNEILPPHAGFPALEGETNADVLIIGAGFAGLSATRRLQQLDRKLRVVLLEARRVAEGPAGRNSGFMIDLPHNLSSANYAGITQADLQQTQINRSAIAFARDAVNELGISEEAFSETGKINAAATQRGHQHNLDYARHLEAMGEKYSHLDAGAMQEICGSGYYRSGLFTPGTAVLQPALYVRSLADGLAQLGMMIHEASPVLALQKTSGGWQAKTPEGTVNANKVVLATNGHAESFGFFKRRLMHVYLYASMTAPLDDDQMRRLGGEVRWGFTPAEPMGSTVRKFSGTGGTRLIIRNRFTWAPDRNVPADKLSGIAGVHDRSFQSRFPMLKDCRMEYRWGGLLCLSRNTVPAFGEIDDGLFSACCQNGLGTAMGTASGMAIAKRVLGKPSVIADYFDAQPDPKKLPPKPIAALGANIVMRWKEFSAGREL